PFYHHETLARDRRRANSRQQKRSAVTNGILRLIQSRIVRSLFPHTFSGHSRTSLHLPFFSAISQSPFCYCRRIFRPLFSCTSRVAKHQAPDSPDRITERLSTRLV